MDTIQSTQVVQLPVQGDWFGALPDYIRKQIRQDTGKPIRAMTREDYLLFQKIKNHHKKSRLSRASITTRLRGRLMRDLGSAKFGKALIDEALAIPLDLVQRGNTSTGVTSLQRLARLDLEEMADQAIRNAPDKVEALYKYLRPEEAQEIGNYRDELAQELYDRTVKELELEDREREWHRQTTGAEKIETAQQVVKKWRGKDDRSAESLTIPSLSEIRGEERDRQAAEVIAATRAVAVRLVRPKRPNPRVRARRAGSSAPYPNPSKSERALAKAAQPTGMRMNAPPSVRVIMEVGAVGVEAVECDDASSDSGSERPIASDVQTLVQPSVPSHADLTPSPTQMYVLPLAQRLELDPSATGDRRVRLAASVEADHVRNLLIQCHGAVRDIAFFEDVPLGPPPETVRLTVAERWGESMVHRQFEDAPLGAPPTAVSLTAGEQWAERMVDEGRKTPPRIAATILGLFISAIWAVWMCATSSWRWFSYTRGSFIDQPADVSEEVWNTATRIANQVKTPSQTTDPKVLQDGLRHLRSAIKTKHPTISRVEGRKAANHAWFQACANVEEDEIVVARYVFLDRLHNFVKRATILLVVFACLVLVSFAVTSNLPPIFARAEDNAAKWWNPLGSATQGLDAIIAKLPQPEQLLQDAKRMYAIGLNSMQRIEVTAVKASLNPVLLGVSSAAVVAIQGMLKTASLRVQDFQNVILTPEGHIDTSVFVGPVQEGAYILPSNTTNTTCLGFGNSANLSKDCKIKAVAVTDTCQTPDGKGGTLMAWTASMAHVLRKCLCNAHNALTNRHGAKPPTVTRNVSEVFKDFADAVSGYDADYLMHPMREWITWFSKWPANKQKAFLRSRETEDVVPGQVKAMVKREVNHKRPTKARLIQFYKTLATQAEFGPEFYALQKVVTSIFRRHRIGDIDVTLASGMNSAELGRWMEDVLADGAVQFYERDGKNWDSSMQKEHADFRRNFYSLFDTRLAEFAGSCDKVNGSALFTGGLLKYSVNYTVKSGHNDTTLGNSLVNAAIAYAAFKRAGIPASILVAGDDLIVATYDYVDVEAIMQMEAEYGITPEARTFVDFEKVSFISGIWMSDGERIGFVPQPGRLFARLWWTVNPPPKKKVQMYLRGVARGLLGVVHSMPVIGTWVGAFDSEGESVRSDKCYNFKGSLFTFNNDGIYGSYLRRYGLDKDDLIECERWLRTLPLKPLYVNHRVISRMMEVDLADIGERDDIITGERASRTRPSPQSLPSGTLAKTEAEMLRGLPRNGLLTSNSNRRRYTEAESELRAQVWILESQQQAEALAQAVIEHRN